MMTRTIIVPLAAALLASACANLNPPEPAPAPVAVQTADGQLRPVRFQSAHAGEVLVEGVWTVMFRIDGRDLPWIREVARSEGVARLVWQERIVFELHATTDGAGYFQNWGSIDEASARRVARQILQAQGPGAPAD